MSACTKLNYDNLIMPSLNIKIHKLESILQELNDTLKEIDPVNLSPEEIYLISYYIETIYPERLIMIENKLEEIYSRPTIECQIFENIEQFAEDDIIIDTEFLDFEEDNTKYSEEDWDIIEIKEA